MMSLTFGLFTQVSGLGPLGPLVYLNKAKMASNSFHFKCIVSRKVRLNTSETP